MAMDKKSGLMPVYQGMKAIESFVAAVLSIVNMPGRRMCNCHINSAFPPQSHPQSPNYLFHLPFCMLIGSAVIPSGAFETNDFEVVKSNHLGMDIYAAVRRLLIVTDIMVALYKKERCLQPGCQKGQVFRRQVAAGKDEIDIRKQTGLKAVIQNRFDTI